MLLGHFFCLSFLSLCDLEFSLPADHARGGAEHHGTSCSCHVGQTQSRGLSRDKPQHHHCCPLGTQEFNPLKQHGCFLDSPLPWRLPPLSFPSSVSVPFCHLACHLDNLRREQQQWEMDRVLGFLNCPHVVTEPAGNHSGRSPAPNNALPRQKPAPVVRLQFSTSQLLVVR